MYLVGHTRQHRIQRLIQTDTSLRRTKCSRQRWTSHKQWEQPTDRSATRIWRSCRHLQHQSISFASNEKKTAIVAWGDAQGHSLLIQGSGFVIVAERKDTSQEPAGANCRKSSHLSTLFVNESEERQCRPAVTPSALFGTMGGPATQPLTATLHASKWGWSHYTGAQLSVNWSNVQKTLS